MMYIFGGGGKMVRTQIYLSEDQMIQLKLESRKHHRKVSEIIRAAVDQYFARKKSRVNWKKDPLSQAVGALRLDVRDSAQRHDHYIYGQDDE
jgi:hypothetical protein